MKRNVLSTCLIDNKIEVRQTSRGGLSRDNIVTTRVTKLQVRAGDSQIAGAPCPHVGQQGSPAPLPPNMRVKSF